MGVLLLAYTAHDLNRGEEGQIDHYSESSQCTVVGISHCSPKLDLSINPGSASILYSLHKIVPLFGRKIAQRHSAPPAPRARVETFASNGLLINYLNPKLPYQHKLYKVL